MRLLMSKLCRDNVRNGVFVFFLFCRSQPNEVKRIFVKLQIVFKPIPSFHKKKTNSSYQNSFQGN